LSPSAVIDHSAAVFTFQTGKNMDLQITGVLGFLIFIADIWAILNIVQSKESSATKLLWIVLILFLPMLGLAIWWFAGPRDPR
jgi:hypothetical protein